MNCWNLAETSVFSNQITSLTNAKDPERLALLKEVAGTRVYEQRRLESLKIMEETGMHNSILKHLNKFWLIALIVTLYIYPLHYRWWTKETKRNKIVELLKYIEERLTELEEEKEELKEFQEKDRERRCLEYTIYGREMAEVNESIEEVSFG